MSSAGSEAVELAASAGLVLDPWQCLVLEEALGEQADGRWSAFEVGVLVSRQNGKGSILEARELAGLFLFGEELILHSAHEFKTAQEAFRRFLFLVQNTPDLDRRVLKVRTSHGDEGVELRGGARLRFVARSTGSGRGFTGDCVILDEAYNLSAAALSALLPTMSARPNPQVWYTSSAPLLDPVSELLRRLRKRGLEGESRLCWLEWSAPMDADLDDRRWWAQANPALGFRVSEEFIEAERGAMPDEDFARERLGISPDPDSLPSVIPLEVWRACLDTNSTFTGAPVLAVDVAPDRSRTSIAAAGLRADGLPHVEIIENLPGTGWVAGRLAELKQKHHPKRFLVDASGPGGSLIGEASSVGVELEPVSTREYAASCGRFFDWVSEKFLAHLDDPLLEKALVGATKRAVGDAWLWDRKSALVDISPLVAATLAVGAVGEPSPVGGFVDLADFLDDEE